MRIRRHEGSRGEGKEYSREDGSSRSERPRVYGSRSAVIGVIRAMGWSVTGPLSDISYPPVSFFLPAPLRRFTLTSISVSSFEHSCTPERESLSTKSYRPLNIRKHLPLRFDTSNDGIRQLACLTMVD